MLKEIFFGTPVDRLVKSHGPPVVRGTVFRNGLKISIAILSMGSSLHCDVILPFVTLIPLVHASIHFTRENCDVIYERPLN